MLEIDLEDGGQRSKSDQPSLRRRLGKLKSWGSDAKRSPARARRRAICRSWLAVLVLLMMLPLPFVLDDRLSMHCGAKSQTQIYREAHTWFVAASSLLCTYGFVCVVNMQMSWWATSYSLVKTRCHIYLNWLNIVAFHVSVVTHGCCSLKSNSLEAAVLHWAFILSQVFLWANKVMGYDIIKGHVMMLQRVLRRPLGTEVLNVLQIAFIASVLPGSVCLVLAFAHKDPVWNLMLVVSIIIGGVVFSLILITCLMTRAFVLAWVYATEECRQCIKENEKVTAKTAAAFSRRMMFETPLNLFLIGVAFVAQLAWLLSEMGIFGDQDIGLDLLLCLAASTCLANCCRHGVALTGMEIMQPVKSSTNVSSRLLRLASSISSSSKQKQLPNEVDKDEDTSWATGHEQWDSKTRDLASRGLSLRALLRFYRDLGSDKTMPNFNPKSHRTSDVVRQAIIPMSRGTAYGDCPCSTVLMRGQKALAERMVTHTWSGVFSHLVAAVVADALELSSYSEVLPRLEPDELVALESELYWKGRLDIVYWICAFCVNQHASICGGLGPHDNDPITGRPPAVCDCNQKKFWSRTLPLKDGESIDCEMNKFDDMMSCLGALQPGFAQVAAVDADFVLFTRAWCVAEIHRAHEIRLPQSMKIHSEKSLTSHEAALKDLRVVDMKASNPDDTALILSRISDYAKFDDEMLHLIFDQGGLVQKWHIGYERVAMLGEIARRGFKRKTMSFQSKS